MHDTLEMIKDLKKNSLALRGLMSAVELEGSLVPLASCHMVQPAMELELDKTCSHKPLGACA